MPQKCRVWYDQCGYLIRKHIQIMNGTELVLFRSKEESDYEILPGTFYLIS